MILEGIVTTVDAEDRVNIAPMGPHVPESSEPLHRFLLKPFTSSQTFRNLKATGEGVFHITDDVLVLAQAAVGSPDPLPPLRVAKTVKGFVLADVCRYYELRVIACDDVEPRPTMEVEVTHEQRLRDFFGFNRAKHAVLEAAILATRIGLLPIEEIRSEMDRLEIIVHKTGGNREKAAFAHLRNYVETAS